MKSALCTLLYCLLFSLLAKGQDYEVLIEKGDSLFKVKKFDSSFHTFEEALEAVSRLNMSVSEETWLKIFVGAAKSAAAGANHDKADKYWNLAKGSRGEKMRDKISALVTRGLNSITISDRLFGGTRPYYFQECNVSMTTYLLWAEGKSVLVQKFDNCKNYEPLQFINPTLYAIINGAQRLKLDSMANVNNHGYHEPVFEIGFYIGKSTFFKTVKKLDITDPKTMKPHEANIAREISNKNYKTNLSSALYRLLASGNLQIIEYEAKLGSPSERLKTGSL